MILNINVLLITSENIILINLKCNKSHNNFKEYFLSFFTAVLILSGLLSGFGALHWNCSCRRFDKDVQSDTETLMYTLQIYNSFWVLSIRGVATGVPGCAGATHSGSWHT